MTRRAWVAAALLLAAVPRSWARAPKVSGEMVIWSEAAAKLDARKQLAEFAPYTKALSGVIALNPKMLDSTKVGGLKSAHYIVALGVCKEEESAKALLTLAQELFQGVYSKKVSYRSSEQAPSLDCPTFKEAARDDNDKPVPWSFERGKRSAAGRNTLIGLGFEYRWSTKGDIALEHSGAKAVFLLADSERRVLDSKTLSTTQDTALIKVLDVDGSGLLADVHYSDPRCDLSNDAFTSWSQVTKVSAKGGRLRLATADPEQLKSGSCGFKDEGMMTQ